MTRPYNSSTPIYFVGSGLDSGRTGGQIYNSNIARYLNTHTDNFRAISYPWLSTVKNFLFDLQLGCKLLFSLKRKVVVIDESLHQRMAITLLVSIAHPKIRFVLMLHQLAFNRRANPTRRKLTKHIDSLLIRFSYTAISAGNYVAIQAKEITHEKYHKKIKKVLTTVQNSGNYHPSNKQPFKACFAGSIEPDKGIYSLIQSISLLPQNLKSNLEISLCGSMGNSSFVQQCKTLIDHNQLNHVFIWRDFTNWPQLKEIYERSQLYLFPSFSENMPMSLMEAMSCGTVPICFNMSAMPLFITHNENGLLASAKDHIDYANQIALFFSLPLKEQQNLAENANISAQAYIRDWNTIGEEFLTTITAN